MEYEYEYDQEQGHYEGQLPPIFGGLKDISFGSETWMTRWFSVAPV